MIPTPIDRGAGDSAIPMPQLVSARQSRSCGVSAPIAGAQSPAGERHRYDPPGMAGEDTNVRAGDGIP